MGMAESISKLFMQLVERHGGNKANAARSLGVDPTTFWNWASGKRSFNPALCQAIDRAGGILLIPGDSVPAGGRAKPQAGSLPEEMTQRIAELEAANAKLQAELAETRSERDMARGEIRALERQLARMMPAPGHLSEKISPSSSRETHGSSVKAG